MNRDSIVKLTPKGFCIYQEKDNSYERTEAQIEAQRHLTRGKYNGYMSAKTARKVKSYINNLCYTKQYNNFRNLNQKGSPKITLPFVTLTLPCKQLHDDKYIKREMLNRFLIVLTNKYDVKSYLWRAEPQKNGNIHFHILISDFVKWQYIKDEWNNILKDHGYIDLYRHNQQEWHKNGFRVRTNMLDNWSFNEQKEAYIKGVRSKWEHPNTTDIHDVRKVSDITSYVTKYMCKEGSENVRAIEGRLWGCSDNLKEMTECRFVSTFEFDIFTILCREDASIKRYESDFVEVFYFNSSDMNRYPHTAKLMFWDNCIQNYDKLFKV